MIPAGGWNVNLFHRENSRSSTRRFMFQSLHPLNPPMFPERVISCFLSPSLLRSWFWVQQQWSLTVSAETRCLRRGHQFITEFCFRCRIQCGICCHRKYPHQTRFASAPAPARPSCHCPLQAGSVCHQRQTSESLQTGEPAETA